MELLATDSLQSWLNVLSPAEKIAAGLVLVKHFGVLSGEQNVPVVPTSAFDPSMTT